MSRSSGTSRPSPTPIDGSSSQRCRRRLGSARPAPRRNRPLGLDYRRRHGIRQSTLAIAQSSLSVAQRHSAPRSSGPTATWSALWAQRRRCSPTRTATSQQPRARCWRSLGKIWRASLIIAWRTSPATRSASPGSASTATRRSSALRPSPATPTPPSLPSRTG